MKVYFNESSEPRKRCCCNCRHNMRSESADGDNRCDIDWSYISYTQCFEGWCRHWAKDKWQEGADDEGVR